MKTKILLVTVSAIVIVFSACKSKEQKDAEKYMNEIQKMVKENSPPESGETKNTTGGSFSIPQGLEKIVGDWELVKVFGDTNGNHIVDPGEDKGEPTLLKDMLILNADGSCYYTIARMEGRYVIETKDDGKKRLTMYDRLGGEIMKGRYILSVTENELVINRIMGGSDFEIFKRL